jgi:RNA polymerase sigma-70 factor, ECF subfamily
MTDYNVAYVRKLFIDRYHDMRDRLSRKLGSSDRASDALHDAWLRLASTDSMNAVQSPQNYLFRIALNAADDQRRKERRDRGVADIDDVLEVADDAPTPEAITLAKSELAMAEVVLASFSPRRRAIFLAARLHDIPRQVIADRLGISRRLVAKELLAAHTAFVARFREYKG